jgi:threonine/homoserine/homoserine lactone efflux protein
MSGLSHAAAAFGLGIALGVSPGPVQMVLLTESTRGGVGRGLRAMAGANGMWFLLLLLLAAGLTVLSPSQSFVRVLQVVGGAFLVFIGIDALREAVADHATPRDSPPSVRGRPALRGVLAVLLNPGAWLFLATTASALVADATRDGGRAAAFLTVTALMAGVSLTDGLVVVLGGTGALMAGRAGRWIRIVLSTVLLVLGVLLIVQGIRG